MEQLLRIPELGIFFNGLIQRVRPAKPTTQINLVYMSVGLGRKGLAYATFYATQYYVARRSLAGGGGDGASDLSSAEKLGYCIGVVVLIFTSGLAAGLTLGLLSLDR